MELNKETNSPSSAWAKFKNRRNSSISSLIKIVQISSNNDKETTRNDGHVKKFNFMSSFRPVYCVSRLFGLMPFSFIYDSNGDVLQSKVTRLDGLWLVISICFYTLTAYYMPLFNKVKLTFYLKYICEIVAFICTDLAIIVDLYNRSKFIDIFKKITIFDKEVGIGKC